MPTIPREDPLTSHAPRRLVWTPMAHQASRWGCTERIDDRGTAARNHTPARTVSSVSESSTLTRRGPIPDPTKIGRIQRE